MKYILFSIFFFWVCPIHAQKTVFEIARKGTLVEMENLYKENPEIVDSIDDKGYSPLILATYWNNEEVAKFLIEKTKNLDYNSENGTALMAATFKENKIILENLLQKGVNLNLKDANGQTALMLAIFVQNIEIIEVLIKQKPDLTIRDKNNKQALDYALQTNDQKIIKLLTNN